MTVEHGVDGVTVRFEITQELATWIAACHQLEKHLEFRRKAGLASAEMEYNVSILEVLGEAYPDYFPPLTPMANLGEAVCHSKREGFWHDRNIDYLQRCIGLLEPIIVLQFEPNTAEQEAIAQTLTRSESFPVSEFLPSEISADEAQEAMREYFSALIGYTLLRRQPFNLGPTHAIEALRASPKLVNLLAISPDDITTMEQATSDEEPPLLSVLVNQSLIFFTELRKRTPESFEGKR
jgi:hypothetical protein